MFLEKIRHVNLFIRDFFSSCHFATRRNLLGRIKCHECFNTFLKTVSKSHSNLHGNETSGGTLQIPWWNDGASCQLKQVMMARFRLCKLIMIIWNAVMSLRVIPKVIPYLISCTRMATHIFSFQISWWHLRSQAPIALLLAWHQAVCKSLGLSLKTQRAGNP